MTLVGKAGGQSDLGQGLFPSNDHAPGRLKTNRQEIVPRRATFERAEGPRQVMGVDADQRRGVGKTKR
jgi:hypothetical protein